jgi:hypothetical protein
MSVVQVPTWRENVISQVIRKYVKVQQSLLDYADLFWTRKGLANASSVIGVHIRGTDKKEEYRKVPPNRCVLNHRPTQT